MICTSSLVAAMASNSSFPASVSPILSIAPDSASTKRLLPFTFSLQGSSPVSESIEIALSAGSPTANLPARAVFIITVFDSPAALSCVRNVAAAPSGVSVATSNASSLPTSS